MVLLSGRGKTGVRCWALASKEAGEGKAERDRAGEVCMNAIGRLLHVLGTCPPVEMHALTRV
jgi:hypothetical protein